MHVSRISLVGQKKDCPPKKCVTTPILKPTYDQKPPLKSFVLLGDATSGAAASDLRAHYFGGHRKIGIQY